MIKIESLTTIIDTQSFKFTPKAKLLGEYILKNPQKAVFMTTRELAATVGTSEATVVRFVRNLGYGSYSLFIKHLREHIDTGLTLMDRNTLSESELEGVNISLGAIVNQEIDNLKLLQKSIDPETAEEVIKILDQYEFVYVIGSRLSYAPAYYMGWAMTKIRSNIHILKGSDRTAVDWLTIASKNSAVVIITTSRYPNELIRIGKMVRRQGLKLILITDSSSCPLIHFSDYSLVAPLTAIPFIGSPTSLACLIKYLVHAVAERRGSKLQAHQEKLEQAYRENDILFNFETKKD
ncbi:MAG: MurR/RpiR family transcriptional regulator [Thermodesulfobacteriota bacterium]|nr:MurR/RpiR family transcriptional regulator [Thermodesulfobacteriota bacterium]